VSLELAPEVSIRDVSPRDGLQAEPKTLDTEVKRELIDGLALAGVPRIECASFVHPKLLPQMADAEAVMRGLTRRSRTHYSVLVPNVHGAERASALDPDEMTVFVSASETHNWKNVHRSIADSLAEFQKVAEIGRRRSVPVGAYVVTAFGCPYEGQVPESALLDLTYRLFELGIRTITLGDTIGVANPVLVQQRIRTIRQSLPGLTLGLHFHDNRGTALANLLAAVDAGATYFDTALGGIGGSPFSPGAGGNLATEDAVYLLEEMGVDTGIDLNALLVLGDRLAEALEHPLPSRVRAARGRMVPVGKDGTLRDELNG
jgi:hydroxymethylglutaryl-CoA lyase